MRKIFTLAAAVLASFSLWAAGTPIADLNFEIKTGDTEVPSGYLYSSQNKPSIKVQNGITCVIISDGGGSTAPTISGTEEPTGGKRWMAFCPDADCNATFSIMSNKKKFYIQDKDGEFLSYTNTANAVEEVEVTGLKAGEWYALCGGSSQVYIVKAEFEAGAPSTDPVATVTLEGPAEGFVGKEVSFSVTTDVKANAYKWYVDGAEQDGATSAKFNFTPEAERTYRILAAAKNDYNSDFVQSNSIDFVATVKPAAVPCAELYPAATGDTPAKDAKAALTDASYGGNIIFVGAKNSDYAASFQYNEYGLQMCKGGADSVRVELGFNLAVGSKIELHINQNGLSSDKARGFKLLAPGQKAVLTATWTQADSTDLEKVFEYEVTASDKLAGQNTFGIVRSESAILHAVIVSDCGEEIVPATDPVTLVTVAGPAEGFVGQTYSFKATADADVDDWIWFVNDVAVDGAKAATFAFTPDAEGTYSIKAGARNQYNPEDGWINSEAVTLVVTAALEQVSVSASTVWDWTKAASVNEIKFTDTTSPKKNERALLANVAGMNNDENFNSQALLFEGEFAVRDGKYCQGQLLQFNTTVAGYVSVEYSNTGNRDEGQDLERILTVNGVKVGEGALRSDATVKEINIPVEAGDVALSSVLKADETVQYIRIYRVEFSTEQIIPEGIENIDATAKAVKVIYNGQLLIKRGDVFYNAQGAIVK